MAENECTVTHLTPAMGQLVSANATTPIPVLRCAFFVGDILTKRDVTRLQTLASNVTVINMYGTTETQRAVSYYSVENAPHVLTRCKDVLPAGVGMVTLLL
jgi:L-aminoadipate-semialdehyde dehydrogenase